MRGGTHHKWLKEGRTMVEISIIVPVYKAELSLNKCLDSILDQTFGDFEVILINDGSPDSCGSICDAYASKDKRLRVIHKENNGVSAARNDGIKVARGKYITFVDSDDWIEPNMLEGIMSIIRTDNYDCVVTGILFDFEKDKHVQLRHVNDKLRCKTKHDIGNAVIQLEQSKIFGFCHCKVYKTEIVKDNDIYFSTDISYMEDLIFNCRYFSLIDTLYVCQESYYHYIIGNETSLSSKYVPNLFSTIREVNKYITELFGKLDIMSTTIPTNLPDGYVEGIQQCVLNIYHKEAKLNYQERHEFLNRVLTDPQLSKELLYYIPDSLYNKLFVTLFNTRSIWIIDTTYLLLFFIRNNCQFVYSRIRKCVTS